MKTYLDCWCSAAKSLFPQALAGEPKLLERDGTAGKELSGRAFTASFQGDINGTFTVALDPLIFRTPLLGDGLDQGTAWEEFLREVAEAAAGELLAVSGKRCSITSFDTTEAEGTESHAFELTAPENSWKIAVCDDLVDSSSDAREANGVSNDSMAESDELRLSPGIELMLDVELEAALRFGCCEMPLGEILELGPGDVVELDRHITEPVDLVVGNKIVAKGDVVLVNGNFGLRVTEVVAPQRRLESIRCLF
jgi:flagellar motor switch protein FliN